MLSRFSIRHRLTVFHAIVIVGISGLLIGVLAIVAYRGVTTGVEETARARAGEARHLLETQPLPADTSPAFSALTTDDVFLVIRDDRGRVLARFGAPAPGIDKIDSTTRDTIWQGALKTGEPVTADPRDLFVVALPLPASQSNARLVEAWKSYDQAGEKILPHYIALNVVIPLGLVLAIAGSYLLARSAMAPVDAIVRAARQISEQDLSRRLPVRHPHDELGHLAITFNELLARLESAFVEREAALTAREEALTRQQRFVADASHELRTPLTAILGYTRTIQRWGTDNPAVASESLTALERDARRMQSLVVDLLQLARGDEESSLTLTTIDLVEVARAAVTATLAAHGDRIEIDLKPLTEHVIAWGDREEIHRVLAILLDNAVKFSNGRERSGISLVVRASRGGAAIDVTDNGSGIAPEHLDAIFDRFYQIDPARSASGTGLGLAIARQIVEHHGGSLTVTSIPGSGSTFTLWLPGVVPEREEAGNTPASYHPRAASASLSRL